jgi:16S rRNA (guanine527-N7)-methyltransferase
MDTARIAGLLRPFLEGEGSERPAFLSENRLNNISMYIDILLRWNSRINLTAVRNPEAIVTRHFGESLFAGRALFPDESRQYKARLIDVGSGAGFPGLPIKILRPDLHVTLIESNQKKVTFLREVIRSLTLTNIDVFHGRAEDYAEATGDVVTLRAVERFDIVLPVAVRLLAPVGRLALLIGESQAPRARELAPHLAWDHETTVPMSSSRILLAGTSR